MSQAERRQPPGKYDDCVASIFWGDVLIGESPLGEADRKEINQCGSPGDPVSTGNSRGSF